MNLFKNRNHKLRKKLVIFLIMVLTALLGISLFNYYEDLVNYFYSKEIIVTKEINQDAQDESLNIPLPAAEPETIIVKNEDGRVVKNGTDGKLIKKKSTKTTTIKSSIVSNILNAQSIPSNVLTLALTAYENAAEKNLISNPKLTIIDYSLPSNHKRMWIVDMNKKKVDLNTYVSHGVGSGDKKTAKNFSNQPNSHQSSIGVMKTGGVYQGHNGTSLYLHGLEKNINDNVYKRHIVMHGANYVNENIAKNAGSVGRSFGCPAIDYRLAKTVINKISNGSIVFIYYPNKNWLNRSVFL